ncbi:preprotein translocase subunit YajC [Candidatus Dependentiae bacterium]|nr:preprotein translocase subunit YajC [Candidatus Dependentiae bacterium]
MVDSIISFFVTVTPFIALAISYTLLIKDKNSQISSQQNDFALGERIITTSGIVGYISKKEGDFVILEMYDGSLIEIHKTALDKKCT